MDGWVGGWVDRWVGVKAVLRIAYSNQKTKEIIFTFSSLLFEHEYQTPNSTG
jgi:hypothetical protein